jgi:hypothetical protein
LSSHFTDEEAEAQKDQEKMLTTLNHEGRAKTQNPASRTPILVPFSPKQLKGILDYVLSS